MRSLPDVVAALCLLAEVLSALDTHKIPNDDVCAQSGGKRRPKVEIAQEVVEVMAQDLKERPSAAALRAAVDPAAFGLWGLTVMHSGAVHCHTKDNS